MKTTDLILSIPLLLLAATGCTTEETSDIPAPNEKGEYEVNFSGSLDLVPTKANETNLGNGVKATIYAYTNGATVTSSSTAATAVAKGNYTADGSGNFTGESSYTMYLTKGTYDFYAVSCNSTETAAPEFTNGTSAALSNGVDYLWGTAASQSIPGSSESINLTLAHKAVSIVITVKTTANSGIELTGWQSAVGSTTDNATITPPSNTGCTMSLSNGEIQAATGIATGTGTTANMKTEDVSGTSGFSNDKTAKVSYIMLPLAAASGSSQELIVTFKVKVKIKDSNLDASGNPQAVDKTYTAKLTPPSGSNAFAAGNEYTYTAILKPNTISFSGANVSGWTSAGSAQEITPSEPDIP